MENILAGVVEDEEQRGESLGGLGNKKQGSVRRRLSIVSLGIMFGQALSKQWGEAFTNMEQRAQQGRNLGKLCRSSQFASGPARSFLFET